ncbi:MAG: hypothetical protein WDM78_14645 [Puia sp.]
MLHFPSERHFSIPGRDQNSHWSRNKYYYHNNHNYYSGIDSSGALHPGITPSLDPVALSLPAVPVPEISVRMVPSIKLEGTLVGSFGSCCFSAICLLQAVAREKMATIKNISFIFFHTFFL